MKNNFGLLGTLLLQMPRGAQRRMPGKRQLFLNGEDSHAHSLARIRFRRRAER